MAGDGFNNRPGIGGTILNNAASNVSGIFSTKPTAKYASGARCILKINDRICGFAFGVSWRINTMFTEINTVDDYMPHELAPQRVSVEGTITALHIPGQSATVLQWQPDALSFLFHKYLSIEVRDSETDQLLFATAKAIIVSKTEDIKVDSLAQVTLNWKAIGWRDERTPELPEKYDSDSSQAGNSNNKSTGLTAKLQGAAGKLRGFKV
jgi:hypothetical protein